MPYEGLSVSQDCSDRQVLSTGSCPVLGETSLADHALDLSKIAALSCMFLCHRLLLDTAAPVPLKDAEEQPFVPPPISWHLSLCGVEEGCPWPL